jgi:hypothetical protein
MGSSITPLRNKLFYDVPGGFQYDHNQMIVTVMEFLFNTMTVNEIQGEQPHYFFICFNDTIKYPSECCEINGTITTSRETYEIADTHDLNHESSLNAVTLHFFHINKRHFYCETCGLRMNEKKEITKLPRVRYVSLCGMPIDREIINNVHYTLTVVRYGGSGQFICRMSSNNRVVEYDGVKAGGRYDGVKAGVRFRDVESNNAFNGVIRDMSNTKRETVQIFYKMQDD